MKKNTINRYAFVLAILLLTTLLRLPSLIQPFDNDSGAFAYHARLISRGEPLYGSHHTGHHLPAVYYVYAAAMYIFGDSLWSIKVTLLLWTVLTTALMYALGRMWRGDIAGIWAALFFSVLSSHVKLFGSTAEIEMFANLPRVFATCILFVFHKKRTSSVSYLLLGFVSVLTFLFKASYLSALALSGFYILNDFWCYRKDESLRVKYLQCGLWFIIGFCITLVFVTAFFAHYGLLERLLLVFTQGSRYLLYRNTAEVSFKRFWFPLLVLGVNNGFILFYGILGFVLVICWCLQRKHCSSNLMSLCIIVWFILSFIEATISAAAFIHYYILLIPVICLLAAYFMAKMHSDLMSYRGKAGRFMLLIALCVTFSQSVYQNYKYYSYYLRYILGQASLNEFIVNGWEWANMGERMVRVQRIAEYIQAHTEDDDLIYYWSGDAQVYYLANRRCAIDIIWPIYAEATGTYKRIFESGTKYVILGETNNIVRAEWLYDELAKNYNLEAVILDQEIYRRWE